MKISRELPYGNREPMASHKRIEPIGNFREAMARSPGFRPELNRAV
jgi:hypothetical protein